MPRKNAAQERNFVQQGNRDVRNAERRGDQTRRRRHCLALSQVRDDLAQKQRAARAHHVDGNADEGDIRLQLEGEKAHHKAHERPHCDRGE